jgi:hypothetical protein
MLEPLLGRECCSVVMLRAVMVSGQRKRKAEGLYVFCGEVVVLDRLDSGKV